MYFQANKILLWIKGDLDIDGDYGLVVVSPIEEDY